MDQNEGCVKCTIRGSLFKGCFRGYGDLAEVLVYRALVGILDSASIGTQFSTCLDGSVKSGPKSPPTPKTCGSVSHCCDHLQH